MKKILRPIVTLSLLLLISLPSSAKKSLYQGYAGGMMVHMGYGSGGELSPLGTPIEGMCSGIGGKLVVRLGNHWRVGTEGYVSNLSYGDHRECSLGWGGITADYQWHTPKWHPYVGASIGAGNYTHQAVLEKPLNNNTPQPTIWRSYATAIVAPYVGVDYALTERIRLTTKLDWIVAPIAMQHEADFSTGPRLYLGFMFCH